MDSVNIKVESISIASVRKKRNGKPLHQFRVVSDGIVTSHYSVEGEPMSVKLIVGIESRQLKARLEGKLDKTTGMTVFNVVEESTTSYLKKKRFKVVGYNLAARITNINTRGKRS